MNKIKKICKVVLLLIIIAMIILFNFLGTGNNSYAVVAGEKIPLISKGDCGELLLYNDTVVSDEYVEYEKEGKIYPAYGVNKYNKGINSNNLYDVKFYTILTQVNLWRIITNGYPYKTVEELGCKTEKEAFAATNQAIYCCMHSNKLEKYYPIGKAGERVLNAIKQILEDASKSTDEPIIPNINVKAVEDSFKLDTIDKNYVSRIYETESNSNFERYDVSIVNEENCNYIEKIKITNLNNEKQSSFKKGEKFKILIPIEELESESSFKVMVNSILENKTIIYGRAPYSELKNYVLTGEKYYNTYGFVVEKAYKNETKIIINKKEKGTEIGLKGVKFDLLDENKEIVNSSLTTDEDGKIEIIGIKPGKYFLREVETLNGYVKYDEDIEMDIDFNEVFKITVNNAKEIKKTVEKNEKEVIVKKLPITGM